MVVRVVQRGMLAADAELRRRDAGTGHPLGPHGRRRDRQAAERAPDVLELHTGVDQGAEHHVARRTCEAIEVEHLHNPNPSYQSSLPFPQARSGRMRPDSSSSSTSDRPG